MCNKGHVPLSLYCCTVTIDHGSGTYVFWLKGKVRQGRSYVYARNYSSAAHSAVCSVSKSVAADCWGFHATAVDEISNESSCYICSVHSLLPIGWFSSCSLVVND